MTTKLVINCSTGEQEEIELTQAELALLQPPKSIDVLLEEINQQVAAKIREQYDVNIEMRAHRLGVVNNQHPDFIAYSLYVNECITWGEVEKAKLEGD